VEQQREQDLLEESKLEEVLLEKLNRESAEEKRINYCVWRTEKYEEVIVRNRQLRQLEYVKRRKQDQQEGLRRDSDLLEERLETMREQEERERLRYRAVERGRQASHHAMLAEECEGILELISSMAFGALQQEQLTDSGEVDETLWREWMALFVENEPVVAAQPLLESAEIMYPLTALPPDPLPSEKPSTLLDDAAIRDYVKSQGQWQVMLAITDGTESTTDDAGAGAVDAADGVSKTGSKAGSKAATPTPGALPPTVGPFDPLAEVAKAIDESGTLTFSSRLTRDLAIVDDRPVNYRLGAVVAALLDRQHKKEPYPDPPPMPEVPLKLVLTGKPFAGKKMAATRLAETYNLQVVDFDEVVRECLALSKRPDLGSAQPIDVLSFTAEQMDEHCLKHDDNGNPYVRELQEIGYELQDLLDRGEAVHNLLYVHMIVTKIRSLFPERMPLQDAGAAAGAEAAPEVSIDIEPAGWILVGFPDDKERFSLFENFLSGWVEPSATRMPEAEVKKAEAALLAPRPPEEPPPFVLSPGGYDLHFRLEVAFDEVCRRAVGRRLDPSSNLSYHLEDHPPCAKNQVVYERLVPIDDLNKSMGSLTERVHMFDTAQPEVDFALSYFGPFPDVQRLTHIDANKSYDEVYDALDEQVAMLLDRKRAALARRLAAEAEAKEAAAATKTPTPPPGPEDGAEDGAGGADEEATAAPPAQPALSPVPGSVASGPEELSLEPVKITELPPFVEKLEKRVFDLLMEEWLELQEDFVLAVRQLFSWHRAHLDDFRSGVHGIQQRFVEYLQRPDDKQALVDAFVQRFNDFTEEYPEMRKQDETKDELHQRADDLQRQLVTQVEERRNEGLTELEEVEKSQWVECQVQVLAAQVQHAVRLEARRYHSACQLLSDFYFGVMGNGLPQAKEPPPKIEALGAVEEKEEVVDPKAKAKAKAKAKDDVPKDQGLSAEEAAAQRLRKYVEAVPGEDGQEDTPAHWEFPFLNDLMEQSKAVLWPLAEYKAPAEGASAEPEAAADPKAKAKAKGRASPPPDKKGAKDDGAAGAMEVAAPPLYVDFQQALLAERSTYMHRLFVIKDWAERRLLSLSTTASASFDQYRDWILLRRQKELDAVDGLVEVIKEHIESEDFIRARLTLEGAHLHRHTNVLLRAPTPPAVPPTLEAAAPFRWTIDQLDNLLEVVSGAARALSPSARTLPAQSLLSVLCRLTQAQASAEASVKELSQVPPSWQNCDVDRLQTLCNLFDHPPCTGHIDCVEFLLHIGLLHSPLGWPSIDTLLEVRSYLEPQAPPGVKWPDFWVTEESLVALPLFADYSGSEASFAEKFRPGTASAPAAFDRSREQLRWIGRVLQRFRAPLRQRQAWDLEISWHDYQMRGFDDAERAMEMLDDTKSTASNSPRQPVDTMAPLLVSTPTAPDTPAGDGNRDPMAGNAGIRPRPPKPAEPTRLPEPPSSAVSVRQVLTYLCQLAGVDDGLSKAVSLLGPVGSAGSAVPVAELHAAMLQLGARPTPPSKEGDGRPRLPSLEQLCEEADLDRNSSVSVADLASNPRAMRLLARLGVGRRHCRAEVEKLFPKVPATKTGRTRPVE